MSAVDTARGSASSQPALHHQSVPCGQAGTTDFSGDRLDRRPGAATTDYARTCRQRPNRAGIDRARSVSTESGTGVIASSRSGALDFGHDEPEGLAPSVLRHSVHRTLGVSPAGLLIAGAQSMEGRHPPRRHGEVGYLAVGRSDPVEYPSSGVVRHDCPGRVVSPSCDVRTCHEGVQAADGRPVAQADGFAEQRGTFSSTANREEALLESPRPGSNRRHLAYKASALAN
jgi:hypothetical protein